MDFSKISTQDLQAIQSQQWDKVSTPGLQEYQSQRKQQTAPPNNPADAMEVKQGGPDQTRQKYQSPGGDSFSARISDPNRWKAILNGSGPAADKDIVQGSVPLAMPAAQAPAALAKLASYLGSSGVGPMAARLGANTGLGYAQGGESGAKWGAGLGVIGETLGGLFKLLGKGTQEAGGSLANMSPEESSAYVRNPDLAEEIYSSEHNNPSQFNQDMQSKLKEASQRLQEGYIDPRMSELSSRGVGKSIQVNPEQFQNTEAGNIVKDSWSKQGQSLDIPVSEKYTVQSSPLKYELQPSGNKQLVSPEVQSSPLRWDTTGATKTSIPSDPETITPTIETQFYENKPVPTQPEIIQEGLINKGFQQIPAPQPSSQSLGFEQALRAQRASGAAADLPFKLNPNNVSVPDAAQAQREAQAAISLRKGLNAIDPRASQLNDEISTAIRHKEAATGLGNANRILSSGDSLGNMPMRSLQDYLDTNAGTNFQDMAKAYDAGKAIHAPNKIHGWFDRLIAVPAGRALLRSTPGILNSSQVATDVPPVLLQSLFGDKTNK